MKARRYPVKVSAHVCELGMFVSTVNLRVGI